MSLWLARKMLPSRDFGSKIHFPALCRKDSSVHIIFWEENQKLWPCLISFRGGFGINGSLLHLNSTEPLLSLGLAPGGSVGASGPETFCSQVGMANSHQENPPKRWRRDNSHRETSPSRRGAVEGREFNPLAGPWQLPVLGAHK